MSTEHLPNEVQALPAPVVGEYGMTAAAAVLKTSPMTLRRRYEEGHLERAYGLIPVSRRPVRFLAVDVIAVRDRIHTSRIAA